ncbi:MAG: hypothetical protein ACK5MD_09110 [Flavobacteriales bacterium]
MASSYLPEETYVVCTNQAGNSYRELVADSYMRKVSVFYKKKIAATSISEKFNEDLVKEYNKELKPTLQFGFTQFKLFFSCTIQFNFSQKLVESASVNIREEIADNIENTCEFTLTRLQNHTPE